MRRDAIGAVFGAGAEHRRETEAALEVGAARLVEVPAGALSAERGDGSHGKFEKLAI